MENSLNFNFYNILIFSGIVYGLIFSFSIILQKKHKSTTVAFLILTVLSLTLSNLQYWLIDIGIKDKYNIPDVIYIQFELLIIPFFYLFVKGYLGDKINKKLIFLVLSPFILGMLYQILINAFKLEGETLKPLNFTAELITIAYNFILIFLILKDIYLYKKNQKGLNSRSVSINTKWLKLTLTIGFIICILWSIGTQLFYAKGNNSLKVYYPLWISISGLIYWMGYKGVIELQLNYDRNSIRKKTMSKAISLKTKINSTNKGETLYNEIIQYINSEKLFLNPNISQQIIADKFNISSGYLSRLTNQNSKLNFNDYINNLRVEAAKNMLLDNDFNQYTIHSIALESGFNTKSNFYTAFKKFTKMTPSMFKKQKCVLNFKL